MKIEFTFNEERMAEAGMHMTADVFNVIRGALQAHIGEHEGGPIDVSREKAVLEHMEARWIPQGF